MPTELDAIRGVANACQPLPHLLTGGQPEPRHLEALAAQGVRVILDLRPATEPRPFDEPATAQSLGLQYQRVPVGTAPLTDELLEQILAVLRAHPDETIFFHCASGNRVGGSLIPYFMIDHGMEEEAAVDLAMQVGLRSSELLSWGVNYARRHAAP